jgi:hypothetical protein
LEKYYLGKIKINWVGKPRRKPPKANYLQMLSFLRALPELEDVLNKELIQLPAEKQNEKQINK